MSSEALYGIANTNEFGLKKDEIYILKTYNGNVDVYNLDNKYLKTCRLDSFDNIKKCN